MTRLTVSLIGVLIAGYALLQTGDPQPARDFGATPLHELSDAQLDQHLRFLAPSEPDAPTRLVRLAQHALGQPHADRPLGEAIYDPADSNPLYDLSRSSSKSFVEQTLAMAVAPDFEIFFMVLQRLRYQDGHVSTAARNHNLLSDWAQNNAWLLDDVTEQLAAGMAWIPAHQIVRRSEFLRTEYDISVAVPDEKFIGSFIPRMYLHKVLDELRDGDIVLLLTGDDRQQFSEEIAILRIHPADTERPHRLIRSTGQAVEQEILGRLVYLRKDILGIKVLRLKTDAADRAAAEADVMRTRISAP